jgi:hypothetical protein
MICEPKPTPSSRRNAWRNPKIVMLVFLCALAVGLAQAQPQDAAEFQRASTTHRLAEFPKIHKDGRVWFQFKAPNAQKIQLRLGATIKTYDMEKLADGTWNLVIPYPGPGLQYYTIIVDGLTVVDPGSVTFYSNGIKTAVEVPSPGEDFYDLKEVPHGHVLQHVFYSKVRQSWQRMYVYLTRDGGPWGARELEKKLGRTAASCCPKSLTPQVISELILKVCSFRLTTALKPPHSCATGFFSSVFLSRRGMK